MAATALAEFNRSRDFSTKAVHSLCYAPFTSVFFNPSGWVRVCCHNWKHPIGHVQRSSFDEMWQGARVKILRDALADNKFGPGCDLCAAHTVDGWFDNAAMRRYDEFPVSSAAPEWPAQMEFAVSNKCNLECIMCVGENSSLIRERREHLPPLPRMYSDEFIDSLRKYFAHLRLAKFLGGEPFLVTEYVRIWDMMIEDRLNVRCHVTTNGTQYNARVERILEGLPFSLAVSLDGVTKATVESIRVNANYDELMANLKRFREYTRRRKTQLDLTFCLMRRNWHELGDFCLFADEWDCGVYVNTVWNPPQFGFFTMPQEELREIVKAMDAQAAKWDSKLRREFQRLVRRVRTVAVDDPAPAASSSS